MHRLEVFKLQRKIISLIMGKLQALGSVGYTVEPPNRGHFGTVAFVLSSEVVLFSEVV